VGDGVEETLTYCDFPYGYWARIWTNNVIERLNREIRHRTRAVGTFLDGSSALMLACAYAVGHKTAISSRYIRLSVVPDCQFCAKTDRFAQTLVIGGRFGIRYKRVGARNKRAKTTRRHDASSFPGEPPGNERP